MQRSGSLWWQLCIRSKLDLDKPDLLNKHIFIPFRFKECDSTTEGPRLYKPRDWQNAVYNNVIRRIEALFIYFFSSEEYRFSYRSLPRTWLYTLR